MDEKKNPNIPPFRPLKGGKNNPLLWYALASLALIMVMNYFFSPKQNIVNVDFSSFKNKIQSGEIKRVEMTPSYYMGFSMTKEEAAKALDSGKTSAPATNKNTPGGTKNSAAAGKNQNSPPPQVKVYRTTPVQDPSFIPLLDSKGVEYFAVLPKNHPLLSILLTWVLPFAVMFLLWRFLSRRLGSIGQNAMTFGQNKTRLVAEGDTGVRFEDVAGAEESKAELVEVVDFLKHPGRYTAIGGKIPKGVLLVGPRGGWRSRGDLLPHQRLGVRRDVRRSRGGPRTRLVPAGPGQGTLHHLHR
jgi:cell division protease FtsH